MYTWDPELPEWLVLLYGIIVVVDVLRVVHHVQQKLVLRAAVVDVLIVLDGKPLTRNIRKMNFFVTTPAWGSDLAHQCYQAR